MKRTYKCLTCCVALGAVLIALVAVCGTWWVEADAECYYSKHCEPHDDSAPAVPTTAAIAATGESKVSLQATSATPQPVPSGYLHQAQENNTGNPVRHLPNATAALINASNATANELQLPFTNPKARLELLEQFLWVNQTQQRDEPH